MTLRVELVRQDRVLGSAIVVQVDEGMNVWRGPFEPSDAYADVRSLFLEFARDLDGGIAADWYERRDALGLELRSTRSLSCDAILVEDWSEVAPNEPLSLEAYGLRPYGV